MEYVRWGIDRGLKVDEFAPRLSFFFNAHNDLFEELAKYRAARRIWAREMRDTFGAKKPRSWLLRFHTQTARGGLTAQQPEINIVRTQIQALAAGLGGQGAQDGRRERVCRRGADRSRATPCDGGFVQGPGGPPPEASSDQGREEACPGPRSPPQGVRGRRQHDAVHPRRGAGEGDARRDLRRDA